MKMIRKAFWAFTAAAEDNGLGVRFAAERVTRLTRAARHQEFSRTLVSSYGRAQRVLEATLRIDPPIEACTLAILSTTVDRAYMRGVASGTFAKGPGERWLSLQ